PARSRTFPTRRSSDLERPDPRWARRIGHARGAGIEAGGADARRRPGRTPVRARRIGHVDQCVAAVAPVVEHDIDRPFVATLISAPNRSPVPGAISTGGGPCPRSPAPAD